LALKKRDHLRKKYKFQLFHVFSKQVQITNCVHKEGGGGVSDYKIKFAKKSFMTFACWRVEKTLFFLKK